MGQVAIAMTHLRLGDELLEPGDEFQMAEYGNRNWISMQRRGEIMLRPRATEDREDPVAPAVVAELEGAPDEGVPSSPILEMTREHLISLLEAHGFDTEEVEGTGKNGYVTVEDLREFALQEIGEDEED